MTIVLEDYKEDTIKSAVAYRKFLTKIKTRVRLPSQALEIKKANDSECEHSLKNGERQIRWKGKIEGFCVVNTSVRTRAR